MKTLKNLAGISFLAIIFFMGGIDNSYIKTNSVYAAESGQIPGLFDPNPDIKANGSDGPVTVDFNDPVSITVSLNPGTAVGRNADWFLIAELHFGPISKFFSIVSPNNIQFGIHPYWQFPLILVPTTEVFNDSLPPGDYTLHFGVDDNANGNVDGTWTDSVDVLVRFLP
ncbi:MAG TPA: hypothetical protein ENH01_01155 [Nitrospirae bacterium]|nr:hypothetical protein [Nitrospirota bacterium]